MRGVCHSVKGLIFFAAILLFGGSSAEAVQYYRYPARKLPKYTLEEKRSVRDKRLEPVRTTQYYRVPKGNVYQYHKHRFNGHRR
jgi:hypothetical protein